MGTMECRRLRSALTSYVDHELSAGARQQVEEHLQRCASCRTRVNRAEAVRQRLGLWSAEMGADGVAMSGLSALDAPGRGRGRVPLRMAAVGAVAITALALLYGGWTGDADRVFAATGLITDSRCAGGHAHTTAALRDMSGRDCVRRCVEMGADYVFVASGAVYAIRNQDFIDLTEVAGQDVELEGEVQGHVLTVSRVRVLTADRGRDERPWTTS